MLNRAGVVTVVGKVRAPPFDGIELELGALWI
jgi:hypothetical protein